MMNVVIEKLRSRDSRDLYDIPVHLCLDEISLDALADEVKREDLVNQLGALVDLTTEYIIPVTHLKYQRLKSLSDALHRCRNRGMQSFDAYDHPELTDIVAKHMKRLNEPKMYNILQKWGLITVLTPEKFKQVYELEHKDRQAATSRYSSVDQ